MFRKSIIFLLCSVFVFPQLFGQEKEKQLPKLAKAVACYQKATNSENIAQYMQCFTDDIVMIDVSRRIVGAQKVRRWAEREVIPHGKTFRHLKVLEARKGYRKTLVHWYKWKAHYYFWWNEEGKITKMSLQYAN